MAKRNTKLHNYVFKYKCRSKGETLIKTFKCKTTDYDEALGMFDEHLETSKPCRCRVGLKFNGWEEQLEDDPNENWYAQLTHGMKNVDLED